MSLPNKMSNGWIAVKPCLAVALIEMLAALPKISRVLSGSRPWKLRGIELLAEDLLYHPAALVGLLRLELLLAPLQASS